MTAMVVQFICRGNAFRSIIAEAYLNSLRIPGLTVLSSGTVASRYKDENVVNFPKTLALLMRHGTEQYAKDHHADQINQKQLDKSDIAVCLNKIAYDEAVTSYKLPKETYIWDVADLGEEGRIPTSEVQRESFAEDVYQEIINNVNSLVTEHRLYS